MPSVPVYDTQQVKPEPLQAPRLSADASGAFGEAIGAGLQQVGGQLAQVAERETRKQDEARVQDAVAGPMDKWEQAKVFDPQDGALALHGKNAIGITPKYLADYDSTVQQTAKGLSNDNQRRAFANVARERRLSIDRLLSSHERQQLDEVAKDSYNSALGKSESDAANGWADPKARADAFKMGEAAVRMRASNEGLSQDTELRVFRTRAHLAVLDRMVDGGEPGAAREYLDRFGPEMDGVMRSRSNIDKTVQNAQDQKTGDGQALAIISAARRPNGFLDDAEVAKQMEALPSGKAKQDTELSLQKYVAAEKRSEADKVTTRYRSAFTSFLGQHSLSDVKPKDKAWLTANAPEEWAKLESLQQSWIDRWNRQDRRATPGERQSMGDFLFDLAQSPEKYVGMSSAQFQQAWAHQLSPSDLERASLRVAEVKQQAAKPDANPGIPADIERTLVAQGRAAGVFPGAGTPKAWPQEKADLFDAAHAQLSAFKAQYKRDHAGKEPTLEEYQKQLTPIFLNVKVEGAGLLGFGGTKTALEAGVRYPGKATTPVWDDKRLSFVTKGRYGTIEQLRTALRAKGMPSNDAAVDEYMRRASGLPVQPVQVPPPQTSAPQPAFQPGLP